LAAPARRTVLILGGTAEAMALAEALARRRTVRVVTSLAGRTKVPRQPPGEVRVGGFSGIDGLARYLTDAGIDVLVDATHPYATRISANARTASERTGVPLLVLARPAWEAREDDDWTEVADEAEAANALPAGARALLALGSQRLKAFAHRRDVEFFVRMIDEPTQPLPLASCTVIIGRPSRSVDAEAALMRDHRITHLVCRNSGGEASRAKIDAARSLTLPVIMIGRPAPSEGTVAPTYAEALTWLDGVLS